MTITLSYSVMKSSMFLLCVVRFESYEKKLHSDRRLIDYMVLVNFMKVNRSIKQIEFWVEDTRAYLWIPALACLLLSLYYWSSFAVQTKLDLQLSVEKPGMVQVFVDSGSGYSQEHSITRLVSDAGVEKHFSFNLEQYPIIKSFRVDPIDNNGWVQLSQLAYKKRGDWLSESILRADFVQTNAVRLQWNAKTQVLGIYPLEGSNDPHFTTEYEFKPYSEGELLAKRIVFHLAVIVVSVLICWITSRVWIVGIVHLIAICCLPFIGFQWLMEHYTVWIDRFSLRWGMVNFTSCIVGGLVVAIVVTYFNKDSSLMQGRNDRLGWDVMFEITGGESDSVHFFYSCESGIQLEQSKYVEIESSSTPFSVKIHMDELQEPITRMRLDPMDGVGSVKIQNLRIQTYSGTIIEIDMSGWRPNSSLELKEEGKLLWVIDSIDEDPFLVSPDMLVDVRATPTFPVLQVFPFFVWLLTTIGLLIYNRLLTEGMSDNEIQNLQRMLKSLE